MYYCNECQNRFDELAQSTWGEVTVKVCPLYKVDDYEPLHKCQLCDTYIKSGEDYCEPHQDCVAEFMRGAYEQIQGTTDASKMDILEAMGQWIENQ